MNQEQAQQDKAREQSHLLSVFRDSEHVADSPIDELRWLAQLQSYIEDPSEAQWREERSGAVAGYRGQDDDTYENYLSNAARDRIDEVAEKGTTYLAQVLARQMLDSPLSTLFDTRHIEHSYNLSKPSGDQIRIFLDQKGPHPEDYRCQEAFSRLLTKIETQRQGKLDVINDDERYLDFMQQHNVYNAEGRIWQLVYEMDGDDQREWIEPKTYMMRSFGSITDNQVEPEFAHGFRNFIEADYQDIMKAGLHYTPVRVAPGTIGFYEETATLVKMFEVSDKNATEPTAIDLEALVAAKLRTTDEQKILETAGCFRMVAGHLPTRFIVENALGVKFENIELEDQLLLCRLLLEATPNEMEHIIALQSDAIITAAQAIEFGEDFSGSLRSIAEHAPPEQAKEIFETISTFRESAKKISGWYESYDPDLAKAFELAMNERLSDALAALEVLARDGELSVDVSPGRHSEDYEYDGRFAMNLHSLEEGMEIINSLETSLQLMHEIVTSGDTIVHRVNKDDNQFVIYRFSSELHGDVLLYARPEGAKGYDNHLEYGNRAGVEASISFIVNPTDPHDLDVYKDSQGVSIRFDREGRMVDESPFSEDRDPTRKDGSISLDISSIMGDGRHMPVKIGRLIAAGNILRAAKIGGEESLHHNNNHFDQSAYGSAEGFSKLAVYMAHMAEVMIAIQQNGSHASPYQSIPANQQKVA